MTKFPDTSNQRECIESRTLTHLLQQHTGGGVAVLLNTLEENPITPQAATSLALRLNGAARAAWAAIIGVGETPP